MRHLAFVLIVPALLAACDLRASDNPPNEATALLRDTRTGKEVFCHADWWLPDTSRVDACIEARRREGYALIQKNYN